MSEQEEKEIIPGIFMSDIADRIEYLFNVRFPQLEAKSIQWSNLYQRCRIKAVVLTNDVNEREKLLVFIARRSGIKSLVVLHAEQLRGFRLAGATGRKTSSSGLLRFVRRHRARVRPWICSRERHVARQCRLGQKARIFRRSLGETQPSGHRSARKAKCFKPILPCLCSDRLVENDNFISHPR